MQKHHVVWTILCIALAAPSVAAAAPDPLLAQQWALAAPAIGAGEAWTQSSGAGVLVAVLDTGVQLDHPDLAGAVWTNPGEVAGNGRDDDSNGIVDDVRGANMLDLSANVADDNGHGTHVAGIVAARQANGIGGSGLAHGARILPVKVLDATLAGNTDALARGIRYAVDEGARILNVSVNTDTSTYPVKDAVRYAGQQGAIIVASAGNNGRNIDLRPSYPASLSLTEPAILSVAATTSAGRLWRLSNTGLLAVDIAAPGEHIVSTRNGSAYESRNGTSAAAPFVAASLALLAAARPDLPMSALRDTLVDTTRRSDLLASLLGGGSLDVGAAMHRLRSGTAWRSASPVGATAGPTLRLRTASRTRAGSRATLRWSTTGAGAVTRWRVSLNHRVVATVSAARRGVSRRMRRTGTHRWRVVGFAADGTKVVSAQRSFKVIRRR